MRCLLRFQITTISQPQKGAYLHKRVCRKCNQREPYKISTQVLQEESLSSLPGYEDLQILAYTNSFNADGKVVIGTRFYISDSSNKIPLIEETVFNPDAHGHTQYIKKMVQTYKTLKAKDPTNADIRFEQAYPKETHYVTRESDMVTVYKEGEGEGEGEGEQLKVQTWQIFHTPPKNISTFLKHAKSNYDHFQKTKQSDPKTAFKAAAKHFMAVCQCLPLYPWISLVRRGSGRRHAARPTRLRKHQLTKKRTRFYCIQQPICILSRKT